jgi:hypothetical protein
MQGCFATPALHRLKPVPHLPHNPKVKAPDAGPDSQRPEAKDREKEIF